MTKFFVFIVNEIIDSLLWKNSNRFGNYLDLFYCKSLAEIANMKELENWNYKIHKHSGG